MSRYVGRFAPSPTGPLHAGSMVAALGSFLDARAAGGQWLVRMDDLDPQREMAGAADDILRTLEACALHWDGAVIWQSQRLDRYRAALDSLHASGHLYACECSRRTLRARADTGPLGRIYPGTCRDRGLADGPARALRFRLPDTALSMADRLQAHYTANGASELGDPVLRRRDGLIAYHLATTIDDADLDVTDVVRGVDLMPASLVQIALQNALDLLSVRWMHLPVVYADDGRKLSKQTGARAIDREQPLHALLDAWDFLGQTPPDAKPDDAPSFLAWAIANWSTKT